MEHKKNGVGTTILQFIKFNLVGVLNTLVDVVVFWLLNHFFGWTYIANVISYSCGIINSYLWNSNWTFKEQKTHSAKEMLSFIAVNLVSLCVSSGVIWLCANVFGITDAWVAQWMPQWMPGFVQKLLNGAMLSKLIATVCAIVVNYIGSRCFVFKQKQEVTEEK